MLFGGINRDQSCEQCWADLPAGYKMFLLTTLAFNAVGLLFQTILFYSINIPYFTVYEFQIWRVFITFLPAGFQFMAILNILINFYFMLSMWPGIQKQMSTSYIILEVFIQNFMIQVIFTIVSLIFFMLNLVKSPYSLYSLGWFPLVMIFLFQRASQNPEDLTTFCCMPCLIKMKYVPVIILVLSLVLAKDLFLSLLIASCLGYLQFTHFKKRFIKLPLSIYRKLDAILPKSFTDRPDFIKVSQSEAYLRGQCYKSSNNQQRQNNNPFNRNNARPQNNDQISQSDKVQVLGNGVNIGGSNVSDFRGIWANKQTNNKNNNKEFQIEPKLQQQIFQQTPNENKQKLDINLFQNQSNINLVKQNGEEDEQSVQQLTEHPKESSGKKNLLG